MMKGSGYVVREVEVLGLGRWRWVLVGVLFVGVVGVWGCGGSGGEGGVAVRVGSRVLSVAAVDHWTPIEAVLSYETNPKGPVARGVIPDPPAYSACIAQLHALAAVTVGPGVPKLTSAQLKAQCVHRYRSVREHMIMILITDLWLRGEAAAQGIRVSEGEVRQLLQRNTHALYPTSAAFHNYLAWTGLTMADEMLLYEKNLLASKVLRQVLERPGLSKDEQRRAYPEFITRWVNRTSCQPAYIVPDCKEYKGPRAPGE